jgi:hypothetical protein
LQSAPLRAIAGAESSLQPEVASLPSLIRFLIAIGILGVIAYAVMLGLVTFVTPQPREMTQTIAPARLNK